MNRYKLPTTITIKDKECAIDWDYANILEIFKILNDPDLLDNEKMAIALSYFYEDDSYLADIETAMKEFVSFINMGDDNIEKVNKDRKPTYNWEQDFNIIVPAVNKVLGYDVREREKVHWWTFLGAFMELGECTFSTFVGIRDKLNKGKKLEKWEERIYNDNRDNIILKKQYDVTTQNMIDEIMGV